MSSAAQKLIIAASLVGVGGGVWYFFIRKEPDAKKKISGSKTTPSGGGGKTTPSGVSKTTPDGLDVFGTDGKVHVASGKPILGYDTWTGIPYYEPRPAEKVKDDLMKAVQYVVDGIVKRSPNGTFSPEHTYFIQRVWADRIYDKSPVPAKDLEMLDYYVKKFSLEEAV